SQPIRVTVLSDGTWTQSVDLRRGQNQFEIDAINPETGKSSETPRTVVITVTLLVTQPVDGTTYGNGAIAIEGTTTNAKTVTVVATFLGSGVAGAAPTAAP